MQVRNVMFVVPRVTLGALPWSTNPWNGCVTSMEVCL